MNTAKPSRIVPHGTNIAGREYVCYGPFQYGTGCFVCVHGWNTPHYLSNEVADRTDQLANCGLLPTHQTIERVIVLDEDE
jgi:hypothetical protein